MLGEMRVLAFVVLHFRTELFLLGVIHRFIQFLGAHIFISLMPLCYTSPHYVAWLLERMGALDGCLLWRAFWEECSVHLPAVCA